MSSHIEQYIQLYCEQEKGSEAIQSQVEVLIYCYMCQSIVSVVCQRLQRSLGLFIKCIATRISAAVTG